MARTKAEQKRLANFAKFFASHGVVPERMYATTPKRGLAILGAKTSKFKRSLIAAGWIRAQRYNYGGGEFDTVYSHPNIVGCISVVEYRSFAHHNKVLLTAY